MELRKNFYKRYIVLEKILVQFVCTYLARGCCNSVFSKVLLIQQKFGWPNKVFRLNMGQWKFLLIQKNIFLGVSLLYNCIMWPILLTIVTTESKKKNSTVLCYIP